jgi:hypothetical protein
MAVPIRELVKKRETWSCECGATVSLREARVEDSVPIVGIGLIRGVLAASVMTAFFGLLVFIGFLLGKVS